jgi:DNA-directed RNA polymerase subunit beta'
MITTVGRIIVNSKLPPGLRDYDRVLTKKDIKDLFTKLADQYPDQYKSISHDLKHIGDMSSFYAGSSVRLKDLKPPVDRDKMFAEADKKVSFIRASSASKEKQDEEVGKVYNELAGQMQKSVIEEGVKKNNILALMSHSGARGSISQVSSMIGAPVMVMDHKDKPILIPIRHNYSEGVDPVEYWAGAYGTRKGVISTKFAVADSGYFSKQLSLAASTLVVTVDDCGTMNGVPYSTEDNHACDALLARDYGHFKRNTIVTPAVLSGLKRDNIKQIILRSPMTCEALHGVCSKCAGVRSRGKLAGIGDNIGLESASAIAEPLAQGALNVKHTGGIATGKQRVFDFPTLKQFLNIPQTFKGKAPVAEIDGTVTKIEKAPQGGNFVYVGNVKHYVMPDATILVKPGQHVEAGTALSDGLMNPSDIVRLKGIGAGRKYVADTFNEIHKQITGGVNRKHYETMSKALIDHVKLDDTHSVEGYLPDDVVNFSSLSKQIKFSDMQLLPLDKALNKYLAKNYLYFTIGTRVTPSIVKELKTHGIKSVEVTGKQPFFHPVMERMQDVPKTVPDWMHKLMSTDMKRHLLESTHKGLASDIHGISWVPGVAVGAEIGKKKGLSGL